MHSEYPRFLTVKEVANLLGIAEKTVRKYVWLKTIPYAKINGHVRFNQERLEAWLAQRDVPTIEEIQFGKAQINKTSRGSNDARK